MACLSYYKCSNKMYFHTAQCKVIEPASRTCRPNVQSRVYRLKSRDSKKLPISVMKIRTHKQQWAVVLYIMD